MVTVAFAFSFVVGGLFVFAEYYAVAADGSDILKMLVELLVAIPILFSLAVIPIALLCCLSRRLRTTALQMLLASVVFAAVFYISVRVAGTIRTSAFRDLAVRSAPLVEAIRAYEQTHGGPPPTLDAIVPSFLPLIPETGMASYPRYRYHVGGEEAYHGNPWVLEVLTPSGLINFDRFLYYPNQDYGESDDGVLERIEDWAYLHE